MTSARPEGQAHLDPHAARSEDDRISTGKIVAIGVGSLVVFFLASLVTVTYLRVREGDHGPLPVPPEVGRSKIGLVEQQPFAVAVRGERDRAARLERLRSWGWVDRDAGVAHVPIDRAMELVTKGVRAVPGPGPGPAQQERNIGGQP
jgi:hypothetical protein